MDTDVDVEVQHGATVDCDDGDGGDDDGDGGYSVREDDSTEASSQDMHALLLSKLDSYMPPAALTALVFSDTAGDSDTAPAMPSGSAIPDDMQVLVRGHLLMLRLFRLRQCTAPFALWMVKSKTDAEDVREATDRIIRRLHGVLEVE